MKLKLFQSFCLCFYDIALWSSFHKSYLHKFKCCYNKCMKLFFGYRKYDSVTKAVFETRVPSFETVLHNARCVFCSKWTSCSNRVVTSLCNVKSSYRLNSVCYAVCCCSVFHIVVCLLLLLCGCCSVSVLWSYSVSVLRFVSLLCVVRVLCHMGLAAFNKFFVRSFVRK